MSNDQPKTTYLKDYQVSSFCVNSVYMNFELGEDETIVKTLLDIERTNNMAAPLVLDGEHITLKAIALNGKPLSQELYHVDDQQLTIYKVPEKFSLETEVVIKPQENKALSGLYKSKNIFCTQCESHGFRRITYYLDRPDVLSQFTVTIIADKNRYPILLANGNLIETKDLGNNRHFVKWEDPTKKPAYLFALVAGKFDERHDMFVTMSGRKVDLGIYVEQGKSDQAVYALSALQRAMRWDEQTYGREYELDRYMIVAVSDFNFGAMENKGLNIFNDRYILANEKTATDRDFMNIESVIGHEYFHNWSGNRVTVRDWFQITLKEGLTIFRDQNFTMDMQSRTVKRIEDVNLIRTAQFSQDTGPMAHPIRPDHYIEVNNFYTVTVYYKGSEVIRMIETVIGKENFRKGLDIYFSRYDGHAVTTEEFVKAMEDVSAVDLTQFRRWYSQAGTPELRITDDYKDGIYTLTIKQSCPPTPDQATKENFHIPLAIGLLTGACEEEKTTILNIRNTEESFQFQINEKPTPSLLRGFSAPVKIDYNYTSWQLIFLLQHDTDEFSRWNAWQQFATIVLMQLAKAFQDQQEMHLTEEFIDAIQTILKDDKLDYALRAQLLTLPSENYLIEQMRVADVDAIHVAREFMQQVISQALSQQLHDTYNEQHHHNHYELTAAAIGQRALQNVCLKYLCHLDNSLGAELAAKQFHQANNMTDTMGALVAINNYAGVERDEMLQQFYERWQHESLVVDKWFGLHAVSSLPVRLLKIKELMKNPGFDLKNPNKVHALIDMFAHHNHVQFHAKNGEAYQFITEQVLTINQFNPQLASRLVEPLINWKKFDKSRQDLMLAELNKIAKAPKLSKDVYEIVSKGLRNAQEIT